MNKWIDRITAESLKEPCLLLLCPPRTYHGTWHTGRCLRNGCWLNAWPTVWNNRYSVWRHMPLFLRCQAIMQNWKPINLVVRLEERETFNSGYSTFPVRYLWPNNVPAERLQWLIRSLAWRALKHLNSIGRKTMKFISDSVLKEFSCYHLIFIECRHCTSVLGKNRRDILCAVGFVSYN